MLARNHRLRSRRDFNRLYRHGIQARSAHLLIRSLPNRQVHSRAAVVVSTKVSKRATVRNRLRRRLIGQLKPLILQLTPPQDLLIIPQQALDQLSAQQLGDEITQLVTKLGLLVPK